MAADAERGTAPAQHSWSPARTFLAVSAAYHLPLGIAGLVIDQTFPVGAQAAARAGSDYVFGVFETNGWHSLAGLLLGLVSLYFTARPQRARGAALAIGISQALLVVALEVVSPSTFWLASNGADQVIHATTAIWGIAAGVLTRARQDGARAPAT